MSRFTTYHPNFQRLLQGMMLLFAITFLADSMLVNYTLDVQLDPIELCETDSEESKSDKEETEEETESDKLTHGLPALGMHFADWAMLAANYGWAWNNHAADILSPPPEQA